MATVATIADTTIVGDNEDQLVTMVVDDQLFGIPILQVQDIVEASKITPVPLAPSAIAGVLNLRGRIVTVVDLRKLLGNDDEVPWDSQMGVTVDYKGDLYTLLVDAIGDVRTLPKNDFDKAPSTMEDNVRRLCSGIYRLRGNLLVVLDVARILKTEIIEATPMLTVEERRTRKEAAVAKSDGSEARTHQLSALMTDLNAYESETEGVFGAADAGDDDIKARKRATRHRRPIAERWQEVLEEKARKAGHVAYRMREPDEETVENARSEMADEDAEWAARVRDEGDLPPGDDARAAIPDIPIDEALDLPPADAAPDLPPADEAPASVPDSPVEEVSDLPAAADPGDIAVPDPATAEVDVAPDSPVAWPEPMTEPPEMPETAPDLPVADPAAETLKTDVADAVTEQPASEPDLGSDAVADAGSATQDIAPEPKAETEDPSPPAGATETSPAPERNVGGITAGWWNKLRGKAGGGRTEPDAAESPAADQQAEAGTPDMTGPDTVEPEPAGEATRTDETGKAKSATKKSAKKKSATKKSAAKKSTAAKKKSPTKAGKTSKAAGKSTAKGKMQKET